MFTDAYTPDINGVVSSIVTLKNYQREAYQGEKINILFLMYSKDYIFTSNTIFSYFLLFFFVL